MVLLLFIAGTILIVTINGGERVKRNKLKKVMVDKEIMFYQLAKETNVSVVHISRIATGESNGSVKWWRRAAEVLGVEIGDIIE